MSQCRNASARTTTVDIIYASIRGLEAQNDGDTEVMCRDIVLEMSKNKQPELSEAVLL